MKNDLKQALSKVSDFEDPKISLEQYITPPALAADLVFTAYMQGDIEGKKIVDLGTGTGILGIGASLINGNVVAVDKDESALSLAKENAEKLGADVDFSDSDVEDFSGSFDTVVMNPPFSVHSDIGLSFWEKALEIGDAVYGISPRGARDSIKSLVRSSNHKLGGVQEFNIGLPPSYGFHTEESRETPVDLVITRRK